MLVELMGKLLAVSPPGGWGPGHGEHMASPHMWATVRPDIPHSPLWPKYDQSWKKPYGHAARPRPSLTDRKCTPTGLKLFPPSD